MKDIERTDRRPAASNRNKPRRRTSGAAIPHLSRRDARAITADDSLDFAQCLRTLRSRAGMSQTALAGLAGVTRAAICHWETGRTVPEDAVTRRLEAVFNLPGNALRPAIVRSLLERATASLS